MWSYSSLTNDWSLTLTYTITLNIIKEYFIILHLKEFSWWYVLILRPYWDHSYHFYIEVFNLVQNGSLTFDGGFRSCLEKKLVFL